MKFTVSDLKLLKKMVLWANPEEERRLSKDLEKTQPGFFALIEDVAIDPRCLEASRFCALFCSLALGRAEAVSGGSFPPYPEYVFRDMACLVARGDARIGKRAQTYPNRIQRHILRFNQFDDGDSAWLRMTISTFLIILERSSSHCIDEVFCDEWDDDLPFC